MSCLQPTADSTQHMTSAGAYLECLKYVLFSLQAQVNVIPSHNHGVCAQLPPQAQAH